MNVKWYSVITNNRRLHQIRQNNCTAESRLIWEESSTQSMWGEWCRAQIDDISRIWVYFKCIHRHIQIKSLTYTGAICRPHTVVTVRTCSIDIHGINCCHSTENSVARWHDAIQYESRQAGGDLRRICVQLVGYVYHVLFSPGNKSPRMFMGIYTWDTKHGFWTRNPATSVWLRGR